MPENERKPGESIFQWRKRLLYQRKYGTNGGQLDPSYVFADRPDQKPTGNWFQRIKKLKHPYGTKEDTINAYRNEEQQIDKDLADTNGLRDPEFAEDVFNRLSNFKPLWYRERERQRRTDEYRGNYFSSLFRPFNGEKSNPNDIPSIGWRWLSRHFGYNKDSKNREPLFTGKGTDVIDLSHDVIRMTPDSKQSTALFNEFLEKNPSIYPAEQYQKGLVETYSDRNLDPNDVSIYAGVEDGRFKLDSLQNFNPNTLIFPARNIKRGLPMITGIDVNMDNVSAENSNRFTELRKNIDPTWYTKDPNASKEIEDYAHTAAENMDELIRSGKTLEAVRLIWPWATESEKNKMLGWAKSINNDTKQMKGSDLGYWYDYYIPPKYLDTHKKLANVKSNIFDKLYNHNQFAFSFIDDKGNRYNLHDYGGNLNEKTVFANPNGGFFVGRFADLSPSQVVGMNEYFKNNPSWLYLPDLGGFSLAYTEDDPSYAKYVGQYNPAELKNPNLFGVGTVTPNRLWEIPTKKKGGKIGKFQKAGVLPSATIDQYTNNPAPMQFPDWKNGDKCPTGECAFASNGTLRTYFGVPVYGNAWDLNGDPMFQNNTPKPMTFSKQSYLDYLHKSADSFASGFNFKKLNPDNLYRVTMYYNTSPALEKAYPTGNGTHTGYLQFKDGQWQVVHNIHGTVYVDKLNDILGGNQKNYGLLNVYEVPEFNRADAYRKQLEDYIQQNPMGLWQDNDEALKARTWLRKNNPEILQQYWNNLTPDQQKKIDRRFKP